MTATDMSIDLNTTPGGAQLGVAIPQDEDAERGILAQVLFNPDELEDAVTAGFEVELFHQIPHQMIAAVILARKTLGHSVDFKVLDGLLTASEREIITDEVLRALTTVRYGATTLSSRIERLREVRLGRDAMGMVRQIQSLAGDPNSATELLQVLEGQLYAAADRFRRRRGSSITAGEAWAVYKEHLIARIEGREQPVGLLTGFHAYDQIIGGFQPASLNTFAARTGDGKTAFALNVVNNVSVAFGVPTLFFSLEMPHGQIMERLAAIGAEVPAKILKMGQGHMTEGDANWQKVTGDWERQIETAPLIIRDEAGISVDSVEAEIRRAEWQLGREIELVVIDYLQLMSAPKGSNRQEEVEAVSKGLKAVGLNTGKPILSLAQLSRSIDYRSTSEPVLADLRDSGSIENDSDTVTFLYTPDDAKDHHRKVKVGKNRHGGKDIADMYFHPSTVTFKPAEMHREAR